MLPVAVVAIAYLLGSIPFGYLLVRLTKGEDVRASGSGGTGATNVVRRAGKTVGVLTLVLDAVKGMSAVMLARWLLTTDVSVDWWWIAAAGVAVVVGHVFPVWLGFRGGKGVATGLGVFLYLAPLAVASALLIFVLIVWKTRYVSLGSIVAAALLPLAVWIWNSRTPEASLNVAPLVVAAVAGSLLIIIMHRANIERLMKGTENKLK
ncbi:MAG TPA: glycerol-3-phosphate 1-O-acyltransferase PlsY [Pyrinomonadaceae bacterium]|jgi:glycerol-3-phosphate acyltransferase PlsY